MWKSLPSSQTDHILNIMEHRMSISDNIKLSFIENEDGFKILYDLTQRAM